MAMDLQQPDHLIEIWFRLRAKMIGDQKGYEPSSLRPPSLRDAAYAYALALRTNTDTTEETIEAFVNGLELGAMAKIKQLWEGRND